MTPQEPGATLRQALRLVAREVQLREDARRLELLPGQEQEAERMFELAFELRVERLGLLRRAGVLE